jgi:hypothetical protein
MNMLKKSPSKYGFLFGDVPNEVLLLIMDHLELPDLVRFTQVSKKMYLWR